MGSKELVTNIVDEMEARGLVLMPKQLAKYAGRYEVERRKCMNCVSVTFYSAAKYELVHNVTTIRTLKNMADDGRLGPNDWYQNSKGTYMIMVNAIRRLNKARG